MLPIDTDIDNIEIYPSEKICTISTISDKNLLQKGK
jgi:hypothetical protein